MHPLAEDFSNLKDSEVENRILDLNKKYWMASNPMVKQQILMLLDIYKEELRSRQSKMWIQQQEKSPELDKLINVK